MRNTNIIVQLNTTGNLLNENPLITFIALSLFKDITPQLKNPFNIIVLTIYAKILTISFRLIGLKEDH